MVQCISNMSSEKRLFFLFFFSMVTSCKARVHLVGGESATNHRYMSVHVNNVASWSYGMDRMLVRVDRWEGEVRRLWEASVQE